MCVPVEGCDSCSANDALLLMGLKCDAVAQTNTGTTTEHPGSHPTESLTPAGSSRRKNPLEGSPLTQQVNLCTCLHNLKTISAACTAATHTNPQGHADQPPQHAAQSHRHWLPHTANDLQAQLQLQTHTAVHAPPLLNNLGNKGTDIVLPFLPITAMQPCFTADCTT